MDFFDFETIEKIIGYKFNNRDLLKQAFTRKTFTEENNGEHNDVLEYYGDSALDYGVTRLFSALYGQIDSINNVCNYVSRLDSGQLTDLKSYLVDKDMLSHRIDELNLAKYLIVGKGDESNKNNKSVKEDLFEAIIGAIDIDSKHDLLRMDRVISTMLNPLKYILEYGVASGINYIDVIQRWNQAMYKSLPVYSTPIQSDLWTVELELLVAGNIQKYIGKGSTIKFARRMAAKTAYYDLKNKGLFEITINLKDVIGVPTLENAQEKYSMLVDKGYLEEEYIEEKNPEYKDGQQVWPVKIVTKPIGSIHLKPGVGKEKNKNLSRKAAKYAILSSIVGAAVSITVSVLTKGKVRKL